MASEAELASAANVFAGEAKEHPSELVEIGDYFLFENGTEYSLHVLEVMDDNTRASNRFRLLDGEQWLGGIAFSEQIRTSDFEVHRLASYLQGQVFVKQATSRLICGDSAAAAKGKHG